MSLLFTTSLPASALGSLIRSLREERGLAQTELAHRAGITPRTIRNWEGGRFLPRLPELQRILTTLEATDAQNRQALELLQRPRAITHLRSRPTLAAFPQVSAVSAVSAVSSPQAQTEGTSPVPVTLGDLLRAMRYRHGRTLEEEAARVGVATSTLSRWERGDLVPDQQQLHAVCQALGATEDEIVMLTPGDAVGTGTAASVGRIDPTLLDALWEQFHDTRTYPCPPEKAALLELTYISMALRLQPFAWQNTSARELLCAVYAMLAQRYYLDGRDDKAAAFATRSLHLVEDIPVASEYTVLALVRYTNVRKTPLENIELLERWLPRVKHIEPKAWMLGQMAYLLADLKMGARADRRSQKAVALGEAHGCGGWEGRHMMRARLLSRLKQHDRAIEMLLPIRMTETSDPDFPLIWAKVLLAKKDYEGAQGMVERALHRVNDPAWADAYANMAPYMRRQIETARKAILRRRKA